MIETKNSPSRNNPGKRPRKVNTFGLGSHTQYLCLCSLCISNSVVHHNDVGEFQGGYFIMPEDNQLKKKAYSPARRKHSEPPVPTSKSTYSPSKKHPSPPSSSPYESEKDEYKSKESKLWSPDLFNHTPTKSTPPKQHSIQSFILDTPDKRANKMSDSASSSINSCSKESPATPSYRFAGPAFGNAPHPSTLPLPEFPPVNPSAHSFQAHGRSLSVDSSLSTLSTYPTDFRSHSPPTHHPSLDQLSIDLRRMLNISGSDSTTISA